MKILVTGGAGYLGSAIVPLLLEEGHEVLVIDNFVHGVNSLAVCAAYKGFTVIKDDCRNLTLMTAAMQTFKPDVVIPLAGIVGAPACDKDAVGALTVNYQAVKQLVELCPPEVRIVFPNTNSGYGTTPEGTECTEETALNPISIYGRTKCQAEEEVLKHPNSVVFRLATVFGVSARHRWDLMLNDFVLRAAQDHFIPLYSPKARRNFVHVFDVARLFAAAVGPEDQLPPGVYNAGNPTANITKLELVEKIQGLIRGTVYAIAPQTEDPDKRDYMVNNDKLLATGFVFTQSLEDGIIELHKAAQMIGRNAYGNV